MERLKYSTITCLALCIIYSVSSNFANAASKAEAQKRYIDNFYVKAGVGVVKHLKFNKTDDVRIKKAPRGTVAYDLGVGYKFNKFLRTDLDLRYAALTYRAENARQKLHVAALFLNGYLDISYWNNSFIPYLTGGIGIGHNKPGDFREKGEIFAKGKTKQSFVWNIGAGMKYSFNKTYAVDLEYRYMNLGALHNKTNTLFLTVVNQRLRGNAVMAHLHYYF